MSSIWPTSPTESFLQGLLFAASDMLANANLLLADGKPHAADRCVTEAIEYAQLHQAAMKYSPVSSIDRIVAELEKGGGITHNDAIERLKTLVLPNRTFPTPES